MVPGFYLKYAETCRFGERVSYELGATIEHTDGAETGHYAAHLRYNNVYYAARDNWQFYLKYAVFDFKMSR